MEPEKLKEFILDNLDKIERVTASTEEELKEKVIKMESEGWVKFMGRDIGTFTFKRSKTIDPKGTVLISKTTFSQNMVRK